MAMTNTNMAPEVPANTVLSAEQVKQAAANLKSQVKAKAEDPLEGVKESFEDEVVAENKAAKLLLEQQQREQASYGKNISELTEDDAYNLEIGIAAKASYSKDFLKVVLKDSNYIARWCHRNEIRQSQLVSQGFRSVKPDEVENLEELEMFIDGQDNLVWADLVVMKIPKNIYYAGLRRAYVKSLHATNNRKASEAGSAFAKTQFQASLTGSERSYMSSHDLNNKPIYNPNIGV